MLTRQCADRATPAGRKWCSKTRIIRPKHNKETSFYGFVLECGSALPPAARRMGADTTILCVDGRAGATEGAQLYTCRVGLLRKLLCHRHSRGVSLHRFCHGFEFNPVIMFNCRVVGHLERTNNANCFTYYFR